MDDGPYSEDLRELALARADGGERVRSIAEALQISGRRPDRELTSGMPAAASSGRDDGRRERAQAISSECLK